MTVVAEPNAPKDRSGASGPGPGPQEAGTAALIAAAASAGAGLVHAAAAGSHSGDSTLMWLFSLTAAAQLAWAAWIVLRPSRLAAIVGVLLNGGAALAWAASRTVGLVGPLREIEAASTQDLLAAVLGAIAAGAAFVALRTREPHGHVRTAVVAAAAALVLVLAVPAMAAEHSHGSNHANGDAASNAAHSHSDPADDSNTHHTTEADGHTHTAAGDGAELAATGPIVSIDDARLTKQQQRDARSLLDSSRAALARFPDEATLVAAGYRSIGDGRRVGSFEHFVNPAHMSDGRELDPEAIESIVTQLQADGSKRIMSAMYILEPGSTMTDVPEIAGELTTWHDHQNLCWDASGTRLAGVVRNGVCVPGGTFRPTPPMLHVWADDPACGPFTGIEGHGGAGCAHSH